MGLTLTDADAILKEIYPDNRVENMVYMDNPLLALMPKAEDFYGKKRPLPVIYGNPQGRSATFARAQSRAGSTSTKVDAFDLTRVKDYSLAIIDGETIEASKNDAGAFIEASTMEIDGAINSLKRSLATAQYRQGYGEIGQILAGSAVTGTTLSLSNPDDVTNFEVGMELDVAATLTGAVKAYGTSGNGLIITAIDRTATTAQLTFAAALDDATDGIPTIAAGDYIFVRGDHSGSTRLKLAGLEAWLPYTAPGGSDDFFGVNRSVDATRLAGLRLNGSGAPIEEVLNEGANLVGREGWGITHYFMNFDKYTELTNSLGTKVQYIDMKVNAEISFRGVLINGARGPVRVVPDQNCPSNRIFGLKLDMWKHRSLGKSVRTLDTDGLQMLRQGSADGYEVRMGYYAQMECKAPGANIVINV